MDRILQDYCFLRSALILFNPVNPVKKAADIKRPRQQPNSSDRIGRILQDYCFCEAH